MSTLRTLESRWTGEAQAYAPSRLAGSTTRGTVRAMREMPSRQGRPSGWRRRLLALAAGAAVAGTGTGAAQTAQRAMAARTSAHDSRAAAASGWAVERSGTTASLDAVACGGDGGVPSGFVCWAVGAGGTVLVSFDGGRTWAASHAGGAMLRGVACYRAGTAYDSCLAVGDGGTLLYSLNALSGWTPVGIAPATTRPLNAIACLPGGGRCLAVGDAVAAVGAPATSRSVWHQLSIPGPTGGTCAGGAEACLNGVALASAGQQFVVGGGGAIEAQFDAHGGGWRSQLNLGAGYFTAISCTPGAAPGRGHCLAVGTDPSLAHSRIRFTFDSGATWSAPVAPADGSLPALRGVAVLGGAAAGGPAWAVGDHGTILATADGGRHWTLDQSPTTQDLLAVSCPDRRAPRLICIAVGSGGTIVTLTSRPPGVTTVGACGTLAHPGRYELSTDLSSSGTCLVLDAKGISLDLAGHAVHGSGEGVGSGVQILPVATRAQVTSSLPGATVSGFGTGIEDDAGGADVRGPNLAVSGNVGIGVFLDGAGHPVTGSQVQDVTLNANGRFGIYLQRADRDAVDRNRILGTGIYGIWVQSSSADRLVQNTVQHSGTAGIFLGCSNAGMVEQPGCIPSAHDLVLLSRLVDDGEFGVAIALGSLGGTVEGNLAAGASVDDLEDANPHCGTNRWTDNTGSRNLRVSPTCIG